MCVRPTSVELPQILGLGFISLITLILIELFGSALLKNMSIVAGCYDLLLLVLPGMVSSTVANVIITLFLLAGIWTRSRSRHL